MSRLNLCLVALVAAPWLGGCDLLGIESSTQVAARREAEGKAVGGACRHAARSIESCYEQNKRIDKAAIFAGWREMNDYMRENKMDSMPTAEAGSDTAAEAKGVDEGAAARSGRSADAKAKVAAAKPDTSGR